MSISLDLEELFNDLEPHWQESFDGIVESEWFNQDALPSQLALSGAPPSEHGAMRTIVLLVILRNCKKRPLLGYDPNRGKLEPYLRGVIKNAVAESWRKIRKEQRREAGHLTTDLEENCRSSDPSSRVIQEELRILVRRLVNELPEPSRTVMALRFLEGFAITRIVEETGLTRDKVRNRIEKALNQLRFELRAAGFGESDPLE